MNQQLLLFIKCLNKNLQASAFANVLIPDGDACWLHCYSYQCGTAEVVVMNVNKIER